MSALVNRVPTGRIVSLHTELKYLHWKFKNGPFGLQEMKFDPSSAKTQLDFFPLAISNSKYGQYNGKYDPYLDNPLDKAGFHLTQSIVRDSQKSKSASECFTALEGLGWVTRLDDGRGKLSELGKKIAESDYFSKEFLPLLQNSLLNYGPFVGFLFECINKSLNKEFRRSNIIIGYVNTGETVSVDGIQIPLSVGSQDDSITRTRSTLIAWAVTAGYIWPTTEKLPEESSPWHVAALELVKQKNWPWNKFKVLVPNDFFTKKKIIVNNPLNYKSMTKSTKALRERGQKLIRGTTLGVENKVKNRRFAIVYSLAFASSIQKDIDLDILIKQIKKYPDLFVVNPESFDYIMKLELNIAIIAGLIFLKEKNMIHPLTKTNLEYLATGVPEDVLSTVKNIVNSTLNHE